MTGSKPVDNSVKPRKERRIAVVDAPLQEQGRRGEGPVAPKLQAGDAITILRGDNSSLAFYRTHCIKDSFKNGVETWCGIVLPRNAIGRAWGEQTCHECKSAINAAQVA